MTRRMHVAVIPGAGHRRDDPRDERHGMRLGAPRGRRGEARGGDAAALDPAEVQRFLSGVRYPCAAARLAEIAEGNGAPHELVERLRGVGGSVEGPDQVMRRLG